MSTTATMLKRIVRRLQGDKGLGKLAERRSDTQRLRQCV